MKAGFVWNLKLLQSLIEIMMQESIFLTLSSSLFLPEKFEFIFSFSPDWAFDSRVKSYVMSKVLEKPTMFVDGAILSAVGPKLNRNDKRDGSESGFPNAQI